MRSTYFLAYDCFLMKNPGSIAETGVASFIFYKISLHAFADVRRLETLRSLHDFKIHRFAFFEGFETIATDSGEVHEYFLTAIIWSYETESLCVVKPLYCTLRHTKTFLSQLQKMLQMLIGTGQS
jgi:hypothetical protein